MHFTITTVIKLCSVYVIHVATMSQELVDLYQVHNGEMPDLRTDLYE